ncbi:MAG TPA: hypothetical protein VGE01_01135 [Fimbriimonas sp.]
MTANLDLRHPQRVLVVEDSVGYAVRLAAFLEEMGHRVWSLAGIDEILGETAVGTSLDLATRETAPLNVQLAFLDHYFISEKHNGATVARELKRRGCPRIVAMSSDVGANQRMMKAGATLALRKIDLAKMLGM